MGPKSTNSIKNLYLCIQRKPKICHYIYSEFSSLQFGDFLPINPPDNSTVARIRRHECLWSGGRTQRKATDVSLCERQIMCEQQKMSTSTLAERNVNFAAISLVQENLAVHPTGLITAKSRHWNRLQWANFHLWWSLALWRIAFFHGWVVFFFFFSCSLSAADRLFFFHFADVTAVN